MWSIDLATSVQRLRQRWSRSSVTTIRMQIGHRFAVIEIKATFVGRVISFGRSRRARKRAVERLRMRLLTDSSLNGCVKLSKSASMLVFDLASLSQSAQGWAPLTLDDGGRGSPLRPLQRYAGLLVTPTQTPSAWSSGIFLTS